MCKFLLELLKGHQTATGDTNTGDTVVTSTTTSSTVVTIDIHSGNTSTGSTENPPVVDNNDDNTIIDVPNMERLEIQKKIVEFANEMASGKARKVNQIAVHCTATKEGKSYTVDDIDAWHKARGFTKQKISGRYCGYHFLIGLEGQIMCGRDLRETGAHVSGYNSNSIGVCYVGGLDANGKAKDTRTEDQKEALIWLIAELKHRLNISKVQGHRDYSPDQNGNGVIESFEWIKSCPCFNAIPEYKDL